MSKTEKEQGAAQGLLNDIRNKLGDNWTVEADKEMLGIEAELVSIRVIARYRRGGVCIHIIRDRGADIVLVGTADENDIYPIEDLAFAQEWDGCPNPSDLLQDYDLESPPPDPVFALDTALGLVVEHVGEIRSGFKPGNNLRDRLRAIGDEFQSALEQNIATKEP